MTTRFLMAAGTITGRAHLGSGETLIGKNNQDAFIMEEPIPGHQLILVGDGSSGGPLDAPLLAGDRVSQDSGEQKAGVFSGMHSEGGAKLGLRLLASKLACQLQRRQLALPADTCDAGVAEIAYQDMLSRVEENTLAQLGVLVDVLTPPNGSTSNLIQNYLLFTVIGGLVTPSWSIIFGCGDGVYALNGEVNRMGPFPENKPPYLGYNLGRFNTYPDRNNPLIHLGVIRMIRTKYLQSMLVGTDGVADIIKQKEAPLPCGREQVGPLSQFWENPRYFSNPDALRRRLVLMNRELVKAGSGKNQPAIVRAYGLLPDDTTIAVIKRHEEKGSDHAPESL